MITLDIFNDDAFSVTNLTAAANDVPFVPGQVGKLGLFEEEGITTTTFAIESEAGSLSLIEPSQRGGPGETSDSPDRELRPFMVPHYQRDDSVMADEVQGKRALGSVSEVETIERLVEAKTARHYRSLDTTLEHQRVGALKGVVYSKSGRKMLDLYKEFDIERPAPFVMGLNSDATKLRSKCFDVIAETEDELDQETYMHIHALCGNDFWKALIEHKQVRETYLNTQSAAELRGSIHTERFEFGGIVWERYRSGRRAKAGVSDKDGGDAGFIMSDEARIVPMGAPGLFLTRFAPADYEETVNTEGLPRYVKQYAMANGKGRHLEVQSNPVSICTKPGLLRKLKIAA